jgi:serine/threonine protein kinase
MYSGNELSVSDFRILNELSRSETGSVHLARWVVKQQQQQQQPLIILKEKNMSELGKMNNVKHEVDILSMTNHPNIIKCLGWFWKVNSKSIYILLEYASGGDLYSFQQMYKTSGKYIPEKMLWDICEQLSSGLQYMHSRNIVHRDVKLLNIFISNENREYKLGDFGISRQFTPSTLFSKTYNCGTPLYMYVFFVYIHTIYNLIFTYRSPEILSNTPYNTKTDMWSLGILLYELITFKSPFDPVHSISHLIDSIRNSPERIPIPSQYYSLYSKELTDLIPLLLCKNYEKRFSASQTLEYIQQIRIRNTNATTVTTNNNNIGITTTTTTTTTPPSTLPKSIQAWQENLKELSPREARWEQRQQDYRRRMQQENIVPQQQQHHMQHHQTPPPQVVKAARYDFIAGAWL